jgi:hypothetical protein
MSGISTTEFERVQNRGARHSAYWWALMLVAALLATIGVTQPAAAATPLQLTIKVTGAEHQQGQAVVAAGYLKSSDGTPLVGKTVYIHTANGSGWSTIAKTTTVENGHYRLYVRQSGDFKIRAYAAAMGGDAAVATDHVVATEVSTAQSVEQRYAMLKPWLKDPVDATARTAVSAGKTVRYQRFQHGMLVQAYQKVYNITGKMLAAYEKAGGPTGKLGYPTSDADCYVTTAKCIQSFKGGAVYYNASSVTSGNTHVAYGSGVGTEIIAVAMSQVGYREPSWQTNKYTEWNGLKTAWCGVFMSWSAAAGKNDSAVPQVNTFSKLVSAVKARGITSKPKVGALVFMTFSGGSAATHVGVVTKVHANGNVDTIEGNTVIGTDPKRVVAKKTRTPSQIRYYYIPGTT